MLATTDLMGTQLPNSPTSVLRHAIREAFPDHTSAVNIPFDGTLAQAWETFARLLAVTPTELASRLAPAYGVVPAGRLDDFNPDALARLPANFCQQNAILPLRFSDKTLLVATATPDDDNLTERTRFLANRPIQWVLAPPTQLDDAIVYAFAKEAKRLSSDGAAISEAAQAEIDDNAIVKLGRGLIESAFNERASDLHIQPYMGACLVRIRVDGVLRRLTMLPDAVSVSLLRHFKIRSSMEATNTLIPQDGRMSMVLSGREFDMRVSSLPASRGERLVIRFLEQGRVHNLSRAGFSLASLQIMRRGVNRPSGLVIMTGPTGCGKTSTLYGMLSELNKSSVNIITVENPVEYRIPGISQVDVNDKAGRTFSAALRSILRQDPDVVLIGEIRDAETAEIACQAALTGHLVLSTLHTNDALTAIPRLLNLGVQPTILADSLALIVAQRLCRTLCAQCKTPVTEPLAPEESTFLQLTHNRPGHRAVGCKACNFTGFFGRLPIVDIVEVNRNLREAISVGETRLVELEALRDGGLKSLAASGYGRIVSGDTTVAEVRDAVGPSYWPELAEHFGSIFAGDAVEQGQARDNTGQGVLVIASDSSLAGPLQEAVESQGMYLSVAPNAETAHKMLQTDENITFIISAISDETTLEQAVRELQENRLHISWTRLPTVVLLPSTLADCESKFRETGVLGEFFVRPLAPAALAEFFQRAKAR